MEGQPEKGEITLLLHYQEHGWLSYEVSDDGPGIDPDQLETILLKASQQKGENAALGLFAASPANSGTSFGDITVESEHSVFPNFLFHIPWDSEKIHRVINVLIVDDDAMVADLNRLYVNRVEGF